MRDQSTVRLLHEAGLFFPEAEATDLLHEIVEQYESKEDRPLLRDLSYLTAAEFSLAPWTMRLASDRFAAWGDLPPALPLESPLTVYGFVIPIGVARTACAMTDLPQGLRSRGLTADLLTTYSSDATKVLQAQGEKALAPHDVPDVVGELERRHRAGRSPLGRAMADTGLLRLQGALWVVRAAIISEVDRWNALREYVVANELVR